MRLPNQQFIFWLSKTYKKLPSDPFFEEMNPWEKVWLYESWLYETEQKIDMNKNLAVLVGSFSNYEMAQQIMKQEDPDYQDLNDDETANKIHEKIVNEEKEIQSSKKKRKKKRVVE